MSEPSNRLHRFASNAIWGAMSVLVNLAAGILMSPYLIRKLGTDGYGVWLLAFSTANYGTLLDLGFRSAVVHFTAKNAAAGNHDRINELLSTALAYAGGVTVLLLAATSLISPFSSSLLGIEEGFQAVFPRLFFLVCTIIAVSFSFNVISGCVEGFQQYGKLRRTQTAVLAVRTTAYFVVLWQGGGLISLVVCTLLGSIALWISYVILLRQSFPQLKLRRSLVSFRALKDMGRYGMHTMTNGTALMIYENTSPVIIARRLPEASVGFFNLPNRIVQIPLNVVTAVTDMLNPVAAEFIVRKQYDDLGRVATLANRYGFSLYAPFALFVLTWGADLMRLWVGEDFAKFSAPLLMYLILGSWIGQAGQSASMGILFGIGHHRFIAWGMMAEAIAVGASALLLVGKQELTALALCMAVAMVLNRGLVSAWALCRSLNQPLLPYLASIYGIPLLIAVPVYALLAEMADRFPAKNWPLLLLAAAVGTVAYMVPAFLLAVERTHKKAAYFWVRKLLGRAQTADVQG